MNVHELRAEVLRRQKAATAKIARLRRKGVQLADSQYDVRRDPSRVARYNSKQLESYLGTLNQFTNRRNQFVAGAEGVPIRAHVYNHAQRVAREYNAYVQGYESQILDTYVPQSGMTAGEFQRDVAGSRKRAAGGPSRPLNIEMRNAFEFVSEDRVRDWQNSLQRKMRPGYVKDRIEKQRFQMLQAVSNFGDDSLNEMARGLTDEQLDTLWNYTDAPRDLFSGYHTHKLLAAGIDDEAQANIHEDAAYETRNWLEWASSLPPRQNRKNR